MRTFLGVMLLTFVFASPSSAGDRGPMSVAPGAGEIVTQSHMRTLAAKRKIRSCESGCYGSGMAKWRCICDCREQENDGWPCTLTRLPNGKYQCDCA
jgi:hypothetical protein